MEKLESREHVTLFLGGLSLETTAEDIERWIQQFDCDYDVDKTSMVEGRMCAFLYVEVGDELKNILTGPIFIRGRKVDCQLAADPAQKAAFILEQKRRRVFVNELPLTTKVAELELALQAHGELRNFYTVRGRGNNRTLCYAEFIHRSHAKKAIKLGIVYSRKKYRVYKYRTYSELQRNFELRQLNLGNVNAPPVHVDGNWPQSSPQDIAPRKTKASRKNLTSQSKRKRCKARDCNSRFHRFTKPTRHSYFCNEDFASSLENKHNPLFRIRSDKKNTYTRIQTHGTLVCVKLHFVAHLRGLSQGQGIKKMSNFSRLKDLGSAEEERGENNH